VEKCSVNNKGTLRFTLGIAFWYLEICYIQQLFGSGGAGYDKFYCFLSISQAKTLGVCIKLRPSYAVVHTANCQHGLQACTIYGRSGNTGCMKVAACREACMKEGQCCVTWRCGMVMYVCLCSRPMSLTGNLKMGCL